MPNFYVPNRVWSCNPEGELDCRLGDVRLDPFEYGELLETPPAILQASRLKPVDFAVFIELEQDEPETIGYLVSRVDSDGDGILVLGDKVEQEPQTWLNGRLSGLVELLGEEQMADFGLESLYRAVMQRKSAA